MTKFLIVFKSRFINRISTHISKKSIAYEIKDKKQWINSSWNDYDNFCTS